MRIGLVHSYYSTRAPSGENNVVDAQAEVLRGAGHDVLVVAQSTDSRLRRRSYPVEAALTVATGWGPSPLGALEEFGPDVVHVHNLFPNFGRRWLQDYRGPLVATLHNYRPLCPRGTLYRNGQVCTLCPDAGSALPAVRHGCFHASAIATVPSAMGTRFAQDRVLRRADVLTTLSPGMSEVYAGQGVPADKLVVVDNFVTGGAPGAGGGAWLYAGRVDREKGLHELLERWPRGQRLLVAGDEDANDPLPTHPDVTVIGRVTREELLDLMRQAVGLVFPSILPEGLALVCLEALSAGTPVLAFEDIPAGAAVAALGIGVTGARTDVARLVERAAREFPDLREHCVDVHRRRFTPDAWLRSIEVVYARAIAAHDGDAVRS